MFSKDKLSLCLVFLSSVAEAGAACSQSIGGDLFVRLHQTRDESDLSLNLDCIWVHGNLA